MFDSFKSSMNKISVASEREAFDASRDRAVMGLHLHARAQSYFPNNSPEVNAALLELNKILDVFDTKIRRLPMDEKTAALDNFVSELKEFNFTLLGETQLGQWVEAIEQENNEFKKVSQHWYSANVASEQSTPASELAPQLRKQLNVLYMMLVANLMVNPEDSALKNAYTEITLRLESFR